MMFAVLIVSLALGKVGSLREEIAQAKQQAAFGELHISPGLLAELDGDGNGVDEFEFAIAALVMLGKVEIDDLHEVVAKFKSLDADGTGLITRSDMMAQGSSMAQGNKNNATGIVEVEEGKGTRV